MEGGESLSPLLSPALLRVVRFSFRAFHAGIFVCVDRDVFLRAKFQISKEVWR